METITDKHVFDAPRIAVVLTKSAKATELYDVFLVHTVNENKLPIATMIASGLTDVMAADKVRNAFGAVLDNCVDPNIHN